MVKKEPFTKAQFEQLTQVVKQMVVGKLREDGFGSRLEILEELVQPEYIAGIARHEIGLDRGDFDRANADPTMNPFNDDVRWVRSPGRGKSMRVDEEGVVPREMYNGACKKIETLEKELGAVRQQLATASREGRTAFGNIDRQAETINQLQSRLDGIQRAFLNK